MKYLKLVIILILFTFKSFSQSIDEKSMIDEINLVRTNPKLYKTYVEDYYKKHKILLKFTGMPSYVSEAISVLDTIGYKKPMSFDSSLYMALMNHTGIDTNRCVVKHDNISKRIINHSKKFSYFGENIILSANKDLNINKSPRDCVIEFIVDYKVNSRGHRKNILSDNFTNVAVRKVSIKLEEYYIIDFAGK